MGFILKPKVQHGTGSNTPPGAQTVIPGPAIAVSNAKTPSILRPQTVTAAVAIANANVRAPSVSVGSGNKTVTPGPAIATSVAKTPIVNTSSSGDFDPVTGQFIMDTDGSIPYVFDAAELYTSDADWKSKKVWYGLGLNPTPGPFGAGTKSGSNIFPTTFYGDGRCPDMVGRVSTPDASFGPHFNEPCFEWIIPPNAGTAILRIYPGTTSGIYQILILTRRAYCSTPPFTPTGDNPAKTGAASYKKGGFLGYNDGRAGVISDGDMPPNIILSNGWSPANGFTEIIVQASAPASFYDGNLYTTAQMIEQFIEGGLVYTAHSYYERADNSSTWSQIGPRVVGTTAVATRHPMGSITVMHENYNQIRLTNLKCWSTHFAAFNLDTYADPAGIVAQMSALTPVNPTSIASVSGTATTLNATVGIGRYTGYIRFKIDGTFLVGKDYQLKKREDEILVTDYATSTAGKAVIALTGLALSAGSHTIQAYAVNKNGTTVSASGPSTSFTV